MLLTGTRPHSGDSTTSNRSSGTAAGDSPPHTHRTTATSPATSHYAVVLSHLQDMPYAERESLLHKLLEKEVKAFTEQVGSRAGDCVSSVGQRWCS